MSKLKIIFMVVRFIMFLGVYFLSFSISAQTDKGITQNNKYQYIIDSLDSVSYNRLINLFSENSTEQQTECYIFIRDGYLSRNHNPWLIKLERLEDKFILISKFKNKKWEIIVQDTILLSFDEWEIFQNMINTIDFWNLKEIDNQNIVVFDGTTWILHGRKGYLYNSVITKIGNQSLIKEICLYMIELSGLKLKKNEIY